MRRPALLLTSMVLAVVLSLAVVLFTGAYAGSELTSAAQTTAKPNIIFILTDDLDAHPGSILHMPNLRRYLINQGTTFENAFVTTSLCCPSRATILRGQYSHNHKILRNVPPLGGAKKFRNLGRENSTIATWLDSGGYETVEIGKYLNGYEPPVPPGWDKWYGGGTGGDYTTDHYAREAAQFIRGTKGKSQPFFMWLSTKAPHKPAIPPPRYADRFPDATAPRPPSFSEADVSDKPNWIRQKDPLTSDEMAGIDELYRNRLRSMLAVDDLIGKVVESLKYSNNFSNTYIVFTSDNGFTMGQHRRHGDDDKWSAYEEDIRVPLIVRGPDVPEGVKHTHMVLNNDFAPTFAKLGRVSTPSFVDGHSFVPLLRSSPPSASNWRSAFLEEAAAYEGFRPAFEAVRTQDRLWVEYANGDRELYNLAQDPYELQSLHQTAPAELKGHQASRLDRLRGCARDQCRTAEGF